jgi:tetratricopeptide (TPR) repeat protein
MSRVIYYIYLLSLLIIPATLFFLVVPWTFPLAGSLLLLLFILEIIRSRNQRVPAKPPPGLLPLFLLSIFMLFQLVPLPPFLLKLFSAKTWQLYAGTIWITHPGTWMPLSIFPKGTGAEFYRFSFYSVLYLLTVQILNDRDRVKTAASLFAISAAVCSLFAILGNFIWNSKPGPEEGVLESTFHLPSTEACLAITVTVLPVFLGLFLAVRPRIKYGTIRDRMRNYLARPKANRHLILFIVTILFSAFIFLSFSRGANVCAFLSTVLLGLFLLSRGQKKSGFVVFLYMMVFLAGALISPPVSPLAVPPGSLVTSRIGSLGSQLLLGTGVGASQGTSPFRFLAGEVLAGLLVVWFILVFLRGSVSKWFVRRNTTAIHLFPSVLAGLAALLASMLLFPGALPLGVEISTFFFLAGLAVSSAHISSRNGEKPEEKPFARRRLRVGMALWSPLLIGGFILNSGVLLGKIQAFSFEGLEYKTAGQIESLQRKALGASRWAPLEPFYPFYAGRCRLALKDLPGARGYFLKALGLNPSNGEYLEELGLLSDRLGEDEAAGEFLKAGVRYGDFNSGRYQRLVSWLLAKGKTDEALNQTRAGLARSPADTSAFLELISPYKIPADKLERILPQRSLAYLAFGDYLLDRGKKAEGENCYNTALYLAGKESPPEREVFQRLYRHYLSQGQIDEALSAIMAGTNSFPGDVDLRTKAANLYERLGITYKAAEEYRQILLADPGNPQATERLKDLTSGQ